MVTLTHFLILVTSTQSNSQTNWKLKHHVHYWYLSNNSYKPVETCVFTWLTCGLCVSVVEYYSNCSQILFCSKWTASTYNIFVKNTSVSRCSNPVHIVDSYSGKLIVIDYVFRTLKCHECYECCSVGYIFEFKLKLPKDIFLYIPHYNHLLMQHPYSTLILRI